MVSTQETQRALLTPGEVMQLPASESVVMVAGTPPIKARKLRYFADKNFMGRLFDPPASTNLPAIRPDDWLKRVMNGAHSDVLPPAGTRQSEEGGHEKTLAPGMEAESRKPAEPKIRAPSTNPDDEFQEAHTDTAKQAQRAMGLDRADHDLLSDF